MNAVAEYLDLPTIQVYEVATFYSMFQTKREVGRTTSRFAPTFPACCAAPRTLLSTSKSKLGIKLGESTADGRIYLKREEECLAACCGAPMMMVITSITKTSRSRMVDEILDGLD